MIQAELHWSSFVRYTVVQSVILLRELIGAAAPFQYFTATLGQLQRKECVNVPFASGLGPFLVDTADGSDIPRGSDILGNKFTGE